MKNIIQGVKGARDFYPEEMAVRSWLYSKFRQVSESFGYQEYDGPFLEPLELYAAKSGEELVKEQSYVFPDRGGQEITLRPELTPSLARMVAARQNELAYPLRWWSFGPFWRYERPQKGRSREFFQWNLDLIGTNSAAADAEVIAVLARLFASVGLKSSEVKVFINDRRLMDRELGRIGISPELRPKASQWIDRKSKLALEAWSSYGTELGFSAEQQQQVSAMLVDTELWQSFPQLKELFDVLEGLGVKDYVAFDPSIVRGLAYYTGTVFEAHQLSGNIRRAVMGGGRYDNLLADVGGQPLGGVGFAMGDVVVSLILKELKCIPENLGSCPADILVTVFDPSAFAASARLADTLRAEGLRCICYPETAKLPKQFKFADRMQIPYVVVLGPDEIAAGKVTLKDLRKAEQFSLTNSELIARLKGL